MLVFADKPLELWDAKALCLLKELPSQNPIFPAVVSHVNTATVLSEIFMR